RTSRAPLLPRDRIGRAGAARVGGLLPRAAARRGVTHPAAIVTPTSRSFAVCAALLRAAAPLAPADLRRDWLREWEAELWFTVAPHRKSARPCAARLVARCAGAWVHAAWLRWDRWRLEMLLQDIKY